METFPGETLSQNQNKVTYIDLSPDHVTGLSEGAGSFTYSKLRTNVVPRFAIKLPDSDRNLIYSIMRFFSVGNVYHAGKTNMVFIASSSNDLARIIEHFDQYPLKGHKLDCYKLWRKLVELKRDFRRSNYIELDSLASALSSMTAKGIRRRALTSPQEQH